MTAAMYMTDAAHAGSRSAHTRLETPHGPVHTWSPEKFDRASAGIIVYVHGYFTDVDRAWSRHRLAWQFAESGINALFIACEAPDGPRDDIKWSSIDKLLDSVASGLDEQLPKGRLVVVGHSGAHRTISSWLGEDRVNTIVLVDALYGKTAQFREWFHAREERRLIDASVLTRRWSDRLHAELAEGLVFKGFPPASAGKLRGARHARVVYVRSQPDHMSLVTGGIALPMLLRAVQLPVVASASITAPIRTW